MAYYCYKCSCEIALSSDAVVGRNESCSKCNSDLRCCYNCEFYDESCYNHCKEPLSDRVLDKDRSNFCDYFHFAKDRKGNQTEKATYLKDLDDLFK